MHDLDVYKRQVLSHADQASIISMAKSNSVGSLRTAMDIYAEQNPDSVLAHGINDIETLFPEYKDVRPGCLLYTSLKKISGGIFWEWVLPPRVQYLKELTELKHFP